MIEPTVLIVLGAIAAAAAAVKGALYLWDQAGELWEWLVERRRIRRTLADLADDEGWPNGASSLKQSHWDTYQRVAGVDEKLDDVLHQLERLITDR